MWCDFMKKEYVQVKGIVHEFNFSHLISDWQVRDYGI